MEKEISSGTMLGIVLIALAAVIGLGFGVFSIAKGVANEGTVGVQDNLAVVSESSFEDYNDKIVTGTQVKSAVTTFTGKSVAILINNTAMDKEVKPYANHASIFVYNMSTNGGALTFSGNDITGKSDNIGKAQTDKNKHYYINYNALFGTATGDSDSITITASGSLTLKDGVYQAASVPFAVDPSSGKVMFDNTVGGYGRTGNCEYISPTAKYDSNLIQDEAGTTIGIVFTQRNV